MSYLYFSTYISTSILLLAFAFINLSAKSYANPIDTMDKGHSYVEPSKKLIQQLYIFGDSMSDNGHINKREDERYTVGEQGVMHFSMPAPYFEGRFTNGKVWPELLGEKIHLSSEKVFNYAYGGATIQKDVYPVPNLDMQINYSTTREVHNNPNNLYVIWIGANDLLHYCNNNADKNIITNDDIFIHKLIVSMEKNIRKLIHYGAKQFLILEQIDLSLNPQSIEKDKTHTGYSKKLENLVALYNNANHNLIAKLRQEFPELKFYNFNFSHLFPASDEIVHNYGFNYLKESCIGQDNICGNPDEYIFWDKLHPTTKVHAILADEILKLFIQ